jgi:hypothetical protein
MKQVNDSLEKLIAKLISEAMKGDINALCFLVGRRIAAPKPTDNPVHFELPDTIAPGDLEALTHTLLKAVSFGQVSPDQAARLGSLLHSHVQIVSAADVAKLREEVADLRSTLRGGSPTLDLSAVQDDDLEDEEDGGFEPSFTEDAES